MSAYLGQVQAAMEEFNELMSATPTIEKQLEQRAKMFLIVTLVGLPSDLFFEIKVLCIHNRLIIKQMMGIGHL